MTLFGNLNLTILLGLSGVYTMEKTTQSDCTVKIIRVEKAWKQGCERLRSLDKSQECIIVN